MLFIVRNMLAEPIDIKDLKFSVDKDCECNLLEKLDLFKILQSTDLEKLLEKRYLVLSIGSGYFSITDSIKYLKTLRSFINDQDEIIKYFNIKNKTNNSEIKTYNTGIQAKRENWNKFSKFIENQFNHGGEKYCLPFQPDKEVTDVLCEMSPGKTGIDWIMQTIVKYCGRFINFQREKDLFKIATFAYIAWLKKGYHLSESHDEDTNREKED